ncbi:MAG: S9 family peptidase [Chloroflexi bacterium]|nr:S9 family peptidase [Chloroflexota bacterium]
MTKQLTVEASVRIESISDVQVSPSDGSVAYVAGNAYTKGDGSKSPSLVSNIRLLIAGATDPINLTHGTSANSGPRWSPDGSLLAFVSDRAMAGQRQIYVLPVGGGEARALTDVQGSIPSPRSLDPLKWMPDGSAITFLMIDPLDEEIKTAKDAGRDAVEYEAVPRFTRVWRVALDSESPEQISPDGIQIWEYAISPDGQRIAAVISNVPFEWDWYKCKLAVIEIATGEVKVIVDTPRQLGKPSWTPDGEAVVYITSHWSDRGSDAGEVMLVPASGGEPLALTPDAESSFDRVQWMGEELLATANVGGGSGIAEIDLKGGPPKWAWQSESWLKSFSVNANGQIVATITDYESLTSIFTGAIEDGSAALSASVTPPMEFQPGTMRPIEWQSEDGKSVSGYLVLPPGRSGDEPLPTVMLIHGGPVSAVRGGIHDGRQWPFLLAAAGMAVYLPNYRGSTGRGLEWAEASIGDMGGADFGDMMAGLDYLIDEGISDPDRLGITGWSYGGFISAWAVSQTKRFAAAVMGAGISDWRSFHGTSYLHTWDVMHYDGANPYEAASEHAKFSSLNFIENVSTPTLILHGEQDEDVPVEQAYQWYRALQDHDVVSELVVYPREPHGVSEYEHQIDIGNRMVGWFERWLKPSA